MKTLRIGHERFAVAKVLKTKERCPMDHKMSIVVTKKVGRFAYCETCNLTRKLPDDA